MKKANKKATVAVETVAVETVAAGIQYEYKVYPADTEKPVVKATYPSRNTTTVFEVSAYSIGIDSTVISPATFAYVRALNTQDRMADTSLANCLQAMQAIGLNSIASQLTKVLACGVFKNPQDKQTKKRTLQYHFSKIYTGKALVISGNTVVVAALDDGQVVNDKGQITSLKSQEDIDKEKADKANRERLILEAEQTEIQLEQERIAKEQAENLAANLVKKQKNHDKEIKQVEGKAQVAIDLLSKQVAELTRALEYSKHETASTVSAYNELKAMIMGKTTIQALRAKVSGVTVFNPMTTSERQAVIADHIAVNG